MTTFTNIVEVKAPPEKVIGVLCDVERWPEWWTSTMTSVQRIDNGPFAVGSKARVGQPKLLPANWQVSELEPAKNFTWTTHSPGVHIAAGHLVEATATGSRVTLSLKFSGLVGPLIARILRGLHERYLATESAGLRKRCEL